MDTSSARHFAFNNFKQMTSRVCIKGLRSKQKELVQELNSLFTDMTFSQSTADLRSLKTKLWSKSGQLARCKNSITKLAQEFTTTARRQRIKHDELIRQEPLDPLFKAMVESSRTRRDQ